MRGGQLWGGRWVGSCFNSTGSGGLGVVVCARWDVTDDANGHRVTRPDAARCRLAAARAARSTPSRGSLDCLHEHAHASGHRSRRYDTSRSGKNRTMSTANAHRSRLGAHWRTGRLWSTQHARDGTRQMRAEGKVRPRRPRQAKCAPETGVTQLNALRVVVVRPGQMVHSKVSLKQARWR